MEQRTTYYVLYSAKDEVIDKRFDGDLETCIAQSKTLMLGGWKHVRLVRCEETVMPWVDS